MNVWVGGVGNVFSVLKLDTMLKNIADLFFISLIVQSMIVQFLIIIYLLFKPPFMSKYKFFSNYSISNYKLSLYYVLGISVGFYLILRLLNHWQ